jgi:hypothetical protein
MKHYRQSSTISNLASDWHFWYIKKYKCCIHKWTHKDIHAHTRCRIFSSLAACQMVGIESWWCGTSKRLWGSNCLPQKLILPQILAKINCFDWNLCVRNLTVRKWRGVRMKWVTPQLASAKRLQHRRRHPTVFCPFQRTFFRAALHL